ncbi:hypothetical protein D9M68_979140 [compost metagenome]
MATPSNRPRPQAKRFCGAPTHSGVCWRTIQPPTIMLGAQRGLSMRSVMSIRNTITNRRVGW